MVVKVYACPTAGCNNYFGHSAMGNLANEVVGDKDANFTPKPKEAWFTRAHCPDCRARNKDVVRVLIEIEVPTESFAA